VASERRSKLFIVSGPSGSGKTSVVEHLLTAVPDLLFSVSCTTRAPRAGEQEGREYHFVSREDFQSMAVADEFLEHANVFGQPYGTPRRNLDQAEREGKDLVLDIDVQGARQVKARLPEAVAIFLLPPSSRELERRLRERAQDTPETIGRRLENARAEIENYHNYDYLVINRDLRQAAFQTEAILIAERHGRVDGKELAAGVQAAQARAAAARKDANAEQISAILETFGAKTQ
jgi:guanylate kinase